MDRFMCAIQSNNGALVEIVVYVIQMLFLVAWYKIVSVG